MEGNIDLKYTKLQRELYILARDLGFTHPQVVDKSQELDKVCFQIMMGKYQ